MRERLLEANVHSGPLEHRLEQVLRDVRLRSLHRPERRVVVGGDGGVEPPRKPADDATIADIGPAEATGDHAADVAIGADEQHVRPGVARGDRRGHAGGGGAVHEDIGGAQSPSSRASSQA